MSAVVGVVQAVMAALVYAIVGNIPANYHSKDLRNFFSLVLETDGFNCFHYRHRPEAKKTSRADYTQTTDGLPQTTSTNTLKMPSTCCCVIRLPEIRIEYLLQNYNGRHWVNGKGESMRSICRISKIRLTDTTMQGELQYKTRQEQSKIPADREEFTKTHLDNLLELHPPTVMPNGNVGTPTRVFLDLINQCRLPPKIIGKLQLKFPKTASSNTYGNVPFNYGERSVEDEDEDLENSPQFHEDCKDSDSGQETSVDSHSSVINVVDRNTRPTLYFSSRTAATTTTTTTTDHSSGLISKNPDDNQEPSFSLIDRRVVDKGGNLLIRDKIDPRTEVLESLRVNSVTNSDCGVVSENSGDVTDSAGPSKDGHQPNSKKEDIREVEMAAVKRKQQKMDMKARKRRDNAKRKRKMALRIEETMIEFEQGSDHSEEDADYCEEWERHEALHDDPTNQERNSERLFENEIELKWEKGGSGLVFYTDAQFWQQQEGDFDEQTADDWDVDMSGYYDPGASDMDGRDLITIRQEKRRRTEGRDDGDSCASRIGKFERHTKGFGRRLMERQGWKDGEGLGPSTTGITKALGNDGQNPYNKSGFGFRKAQGPQRRRYVRDKGDRQWRGPIISTVYDNPTYTDPQEPLLRRNEPYQLKRRKDVKQL